MNGIFLSISISNRGKEGITLYFLLPLEKHVWLFAKWQKRPWRPAVRTQKPSATTLQIWRHIKLHCQRNNRFRKIQRRVDCEEEENHGDGDVYAGLRRALVLGQSLLQRIRALRLVPEVSLLGAIDQSLRLAPSSHPRHRMRQLRFLLLLRFRLFDSFLLLSQICYSPLTRCISTLCRVEGSIFLDWRIFCFLAVVVAAFSEGMVDDGYEDVVNIDISSVVIEAMQKKYCDRPQMKCTFLAFFLLNWRFLFS